MKYVKTTFPTKKEKQYTRELGKEFCVKNRTEPCHVAQIAEIIAGIKDVEVEQVVETCCRNVHDLFGIYFNFPRPPSPESCFSSNDLCYTH